MSIASPFDALVASPIARPNRTSDCGWGFASPRKAVLDTLLTALDGRGQTAGPSLETAAPA